MEQNSNESHVLSSASSTAHALRGAAKTARATTNVAKGASAGPYAMVAAGLWEGRHVIAKVLAASLFLFMLPVLYILMLPSLIFGNKGLNEVPKNVLNDNSIIMNNIAETESSIEAILREKHNRILRVINTAISNLGSDCEHSIVDDFADQIIYESALIISQFCASQDDYKEINLNKLEQMLRDGTDQIFSYFVTVTSRDEKDSQGNITTIYHYEYTIEYAGDSYFADNVFHLSAEQAETASIYASNLHLFLYDTVYKVTINYNLAPGETGNKAVDLALTKLGTAYSRPLRDHSGYFDCSSFTYWVYKQLGINLMYDGSNTAAAQGRYIVENNLVITYESLAPGDLVFYSFGVNNRYMNIDHVAIYAGDGYVVDASSSKKKVVYRPIYSINNIVLCGRPYTAP